MSMIEFRDVSRKFGHVEAVRDLNFEIARGDVVGLLGANGAGKTTTMRLMTGYFPPSSGEVRVGNQPIEKNPLKVKRQIGYLPEQPPLYDEMIVSNYLQYVSRLKEIPSSQISGKIEKALARLELEEQADRLVGNLSRGYRQRVALAQALIHEPDILVLDEPTLGLDPKQVRRLRSLIQELAESSTLIISSHILPEVREICQRVVILHKGEMIAVDTPEKLATDMAKGQTWELTVSNPPDDWGTQLRELDIMENVETLDQNKYQLIFEAGNETDRKHLFEFCCEKNVPILSLTQSELDLEEIFLELTKDDASSSVKTVNSNESP